MEFMEVQRESIERARARVAPLNKLGERAASRTNVERAARKCILR